MKCLLLVFVAVAYISATYAAPVSSRLQRKHDLANQKKLHGLICHTVGLMKYDCARAHLPGKVLSLFRRLLFKLFGSFDGNVIGGHCNCNSSHHQSEPAKTQVSTLAQTLIKAEMQDLIVAAREEGYALAQAVLKAEMEDLVDIAREEGYAVTQEQDDDNVMAAIERLPEKAQAQLFWSLLPAGLSLLSDFFDN